MASEQSRGWGLISTAPMDGQFVVAAKNAEWVRAFDHYPYPFKQRWNGAKWEAEDGRVYEPQPTHWWNTTGAASEMELLPCPLCGVAYTQEPPAWTGGDAYAEHPRLGSPLDGHCILSGHQFALLPTIVASWNTRPVPAPVGVKELEWVDTEAGSIASNARGYRIEKDENDRFYVRSSEATNLFATIEFAASLPEAKAVAQAHHKQRTLSALTSPQASEAGE